MRKLFLPIALSLLALPTFAATYQNTVNVNAYVTTYVVFDPAPDINFTAGNFGVLSPGSYSTGTSAFQVHTNVPLNPISVSTNGLGVFDATKFDQGVGSPSVSPTLVAAGDHTLTVTVTVKPKMTTAPNTYNGGVVTVTATG